MACNALNDKAADAPNSSDPSALSLANGGHRHGAQSVMLLCFRVSGLVSLVMRTQASTCILQ